MATTTPNFGWPVPTSTDLVKDGATAIEGLGDAIDASLLDLKGGTSGQVLKKNSNTDMDFVWSADSAGMTNPMTTTGDTIYSSSGSTPARLAIGSTGNVLTVAGGVPTWAAPAGGGANWSLVNAGGTALTGAQTVTVSGISGADKLMILVENASSANASAQMRIQFNSDTASNYYVYGSTINAFSTYSADDFSNVGGAASEIAIGTTSTNSSSTVAGFCLITGCNSSGVKVFNAAGAATSSGGNIQGRRVVGGYYNSSSTISSVTIRSSTGNLDAGTVYIYKSA